MNYREAIRAEITRIVRRAAELPGMQVGSADSMLTHCGMEIMAELEENTLGSFLEACSRVHLDYVGLGYQDLARFVLMFQATVLQDQGEDILARSIRATMELV